MSLLPVNLNLGNVPSCPTLAHWNMIAKAPISVSVMEQITPPTLLPPANKVAGR